MTTSTLGDAAARVLVDVKARMLFKERRKRLGMDSPVEPVFLPPKEGNDNRVTERPRHVNGAWRGAPRRE